MTLYVFAYTDYATAQAFLVEADSKLEAIGKATELNYGQSPYGDPIPVSEVMDGRDAVRLA